MRKVCLFCSQNNQMADIFLEEITWWFVGFFSWLSFSDADWLSRQTPITWVSVAERSGFRARRSWIQPSRPPELNHVELKGIISLFDLVNGFVQTSSFFFLRPPFCSVLKVLGKRFRQFIEIFVLDSFVCRLFQRSVKCFCSGASLPGKYFFEFYQEPHQYLYRRNRLDKCWHEFLICLIQLK